MPTLVRPPAAPRPPVRLPRRDVAPRERALEVLRGVGAAGLLLAVAAGVPLALWQLVGNPLPSALPDRGWLDAELSAGAVVDVLAVVLWALWAHFLCCVLAELRTFGRGGAAGRVPLGGVNQVLAQRLVAAVLLLAAGAVWVPGSQVAATLVPAVATSTPGASSTPGAAEAGAARGAAPVAAPDAGWAEAPAAGAAPVAPGTAAHAEGFVTYVVQPPQGRHHDCLWDIAERTLGDPMRYHEIHELNRDRVQPDGARLVDADLVRPGWTLLLPADAVGGQAAPVAPPVPTPPVPTPPAPATPASPDGAAATGASTAAPDDLGARAALSGGLLLAGVLVALRRSPGAAAQEAARELRGADPERARFLDTALRQLAAARADAGLPLPEVVAAHLSADELVLHLGTHLSGAAARPPRPWTVLEGGAWRVTRAAVDEGTVPADAPAPYPALVDVGRSGAHEVLLDLESAPGPVAFGGSADTARDVVTSLAVELATNSWSDGVDVHLVGFGDELSVLAPSTLHTHALLDGVLDRFEARATTAAPDLLAGRVLREADRLRPSVIAVSGPPTDRQFRRLRALTAGGRTPVAVLCVGDVPGAGWRFSVAADGTLDLGVLGLRGTAWRLPPAEYEPWLAALRAAL